MNTTHNTHSAVYTALLAAFDCGCVLVALGFAGYASLPTGGTTTLLENIFAHAGYFVAFVVGWPFFATPNRLFVSRRRDALGAIFYDISKAVVVTTFFTGFVMAFVLNHGVERAFLGWFGAGALFCVAWFRLMLQVSLRSLRAHGRNAKHVVIIGANERTKRLAGIVHKNPHFGYHLVGLLEDDPARCRMFEEYNLPYLGKFDALEQVLTRHVIDEVYIGLPVRSRYETIQSMAHLCEGVGVGVRLIADLFPLRLATSRYHKLENVPILALSTVPENQAQLILQRLTDIVVAGLALLALSPVFIFTALAIKLDSMGPIFFFQERVGQNQRRFRMVKFRSMVVNAEELRRQVEKLNEKDGPIFKATRDPRITRVGRFIRKYSIDELPQLFNVLMGQMSLVGPRPPLPHEVAQYSWNQRRRLSVKPGMTGLSQVRGRSDLSFRETVDFDLLYIDQWSLWLVFRILFMTIPAVLRGRGAV